MRYQHFSFIYLISSKFCRDCTEKHSKIDLLPTPVLDEKELAGVSSSFDVRKITISFKIMIASSYFYVFIRGFNFVLFDLYFLGTKKSMPIRNNPTT